MSPRAVVGGRGPVRVFISYAHDDGVHEDRVRQFWYFLRAHGVDARLDLPAAEQRVDWAQWMTQQVRDADRVLVIASPEYKRRAEGDAGPGEGRGVQWEARLIRDLFYDDQQAGLQRFIPVVLPGCSAADIPLWLGPSSTTHYLVTGYTLPGAEKLLRALTSQPGETEPPLGSVPVLPPSGTGEPPEAAPPVQARPVVRSAYLEQVKRIAPEQLHDRDSELAELAAFCTEPGRGPYVWWRAPAWAGKSALMSWFVLHPPDGVQVVSFFITARYKGQDDRVAFTDAVMEQLADMLGQPIPAYLTEATREPHLLGMLAEAARACQHRGLQLVLV